MKGWIMAAVLVAAVALFATVSRSDVSSPSTPSLPAPAAGSAASVDLGPIPYEAMSPAEQAVIDHGRNEPGWDEVNDNFGTASRELAEQAAATAAAEQLGADDLDQQGVVP
jgi:hypothetical protein